MTQVLELFGISTRRDDVDWRDIVESQACPYSGKRCFKVRKSSPGISIGTCSVEYTQERYPVLICPNRMLEESKVFFDCIHLLDSHEPGNRLHVVPEVSVPGQY